MEGTSAQSSKRKKSTSEANVVKAVGTGERPRVSNPSTDLSYWALLQESLLLMILSSPGAYFTMGGGISSFPFTPFLLFPQLLWPLRSHTFALVALTQVAYLP